MEAVVKVVTAVPPPIVTIRPEVTKPVPVIVILPGVPVVGVAVIEST